MNIEELKNVLSERIRIGNETQDEWDDDIQKMWDKEIEILCRDMTETINFIENECDDNTFCWIGEVFDDVAAQTQSKEFVAAIKKRAEKIIDADERRKVEVDISFAEDNIL